MQVRRELMILYCELCARIVLRKVSRLFETVIYERHFAGGKRPVKLALSYISNSNGCMGKHHGEPMEKLENTFLPKWTFLIKCPAVCGKYNAWHVAQPARERSEEHTSELQS